MKDTYKFTKTDLFSCPIFKVRIDPNSYDKEKILEDIKYNKSLKNTRQGTVGNFGNCDIHHSYKDFDNVNFRAINHEKLIPVYERIFNGLFKHEIYTRRSFVYKFEIVNYVAVSDGQYLPPHNHIEYDDFATIHYLNFKDGHHYTRFINPTNFAPYLQYIRPKLIDIMSNTVPENSYFYEQYKFPVKEDDMIIFPAALNHQILPQEGSAKESRITISTNIRIG